MSGFTKRLIIFVRAPRPGEVKTRLAAEIGPVAAADAYRLLVLTLVNRLAPLRNVELHYAPADAADEVCPWLRAGWVARPQISGSLGARMHVAMCHAFDDGIRHAVLIGSDCPAITVEDIEAAWNALEEKDIAIGPATDGGYWLIALRQPQPALFQDITWSTSSVLAETLTRATRAGLRVVTLRELPDVDKLEDWRRFLAGSA